MAFVEIEFVPEVGPLEHICSRCNLVHHTPTGEAFCAEADA